MHLSLESFEAHLIVGWRRSILIIVALVASIVTQERLILFKILSQRRCFHYFLTIEHFLTYLN